MDSAGHNWKLIINTLGVYADGNCLAKAEPACRAGVASNQVLFDYPVFSEQYFNTKEGVRQNFIIRQAPEGTKQIAVELQVSGMAVQQQKEGAVFSRKGQQLSYSGLKAWDANGKPLTATIEVKNQQISLTALTEGAAFPVTIDPIITNSNPATADAMVESNQIGAQLGYNVSGAGDLNGDGYSDVIVGANLYDNGQIDEGAVFVYHGSAGGISTTAATMVESNQAGALLGYSVSAAGDINGDGYSDVIVGAPSYDNGQINYGAAFLYHGSASGISTTAVSMVVSNNTFARFGFSVSGAGDVNGDGYSDVIVGAPSYGDGHTREGAAFVYHGSANGISTTAVAIIESNQSFADLGHSVSGAGDINGDGFSDVIIGAPYFNGVQSDVGAVFVHHGSASGLSITAATMIVSNRAGALGWSVSGAGDVNGDGYSDVIVGAYQYNNGNLNEGAAFVYHGSASGISTTAVAIIESNQAFAYLGNSVSGAGDLNGDGYSDVIVGAPYYDNGQTDEGAAFVYHGSANGISTTAAAVVESNQANANLGYSVSGAGDVNGDGYSDVIVGAPFYDNGQTDEGAAFAYHGSVSGTSTTAAAIVESNQANANLGHSVSGAGDVNGDGYSDVIVGAPFYDNGQTDEGAAFVYHGSASGISTTVTAIIESNQAGAYLGWSVSGAGDVNGDGYSDVIAGAPLYDNGQTDEGATFVYHGSANGISTTTAAIVESNQANANLGHSVSGAGDVNGDGYSDVIVGVPFYDNGQDDEGATFAYHGSASGISTTAITMVESNQAGANLGWSVSGAEDVNGDGYSDVIVGADVYDNGQTDEGAAFIYHGSASGINTTAATMLESNQALAYLGNSVSGAGDINGDGYSDVITGAPGYGNIESNEGVATVYHGSAGGINTMAVTMVESDQASANFGASVSAAGDVNGDGYSDIIVGAPLYDKGQLNEGAAFVYHGSAGGINITPATIVEINQAGAQFGSGVSGAGDVNGDGYSDMVTGAPMYNNGQDDEGAAFVYHGSASGISTTAAAIVEINQAGAQLGYSVSGAGDINGDGYSDVIVGAPFYDNGQTNEGAAFIYYGSAGGTNPTVAAMIESNQAGTQFGIAVSGAGDVNGDGYSDVIIGANLYNNGQADVGAAFVYHGSASGINTTVAAMVESNKVSSSFGSSVSEAGDVNGDGYSDVIVGASAYSNGQSLEGAAFVYHGSAGGISTTASAVVEINQASAHLGYSVSGAGDVNGDGYSDVIVGAYFYSNGQINEGAAFVYHGSATGISTTAAVRLESNQAIANLGYSVSGAGDINGDGYSDVIVGAILYDNGQSNEGAVFTYHGSANGVSPTAVAMVESNQADARLGYSVSGAGDVNGDGYSDVIVGADRYANGQTDEEAAFVYHGSASGISTTAAAMIECNQTGAFFGFSVSGAGDVNGDGYSDVLVGAILYDNGQSNEGAVFVYQGNAGGGLRRNLRLFNTSTTMPIQRSNIFANDFAIGLYGKNPDGRTTGKLVWETRRQGQPFSNAPVTNSAQFTAQQAAYANLDTTGMQLTNNVAKPGFTINIRARIKYNPATSLNGEVYSPWVYLQGDFRPRIDATILPLNLLSFTGKAITQNSALLNWLTGNEVNTSHFELQRSSDGRNFMVIASLQAKGSAQSQADYRYEDKVLQPGLYYYRLRILDKDGKENYSSVVTIRFKGYNAITVYPVPAKDMVWVNGTGTMLIGKTLQLMNMDGRMLQTIRINTLPQQVNISMLAAGTYLLRLPDETAIKLVKQ